MENRAAALKELTAMPYMYWKDPLLRRENLDYSEPAET